MDTGRKYEIEAHYGAKLRLLSARFCGNVVTSGEQKRIEIGRFHVHSLPRSRSKPVAILRAFGECWRILRDAVAKGRPVGAIITYDPLTTGVLGLILSRAFKVALMVDVNGDYTAPANYEDVQNRYARAIKRKLYVTVARHVLRHSDGIKLLYSRQLGDLAQALPTGTPVRVYPNFLDVSMFRNLGETQRVAIVGFPLRVKGVDIAIRAFKQISDECPDWSMEVLGWYVGREKIDLDRCIDGHQRIRHHPPVFRQAMANYIGKCAVVVCASRTEGFPRVIKEAMHAGKACIVSDVGGLPEIVKHNVSGLVFASEQVDELARHLQRVMRDRELRESLGAAAQTYANDEFSGRRYLEQFAAHVDAVIRTSRRPP